MTFADLRDGERFRPDYSGVAERLGKAGEDRLLEKVGAEYAVAVEDARRCKMYLPPRVRVVRVVTAGRLRVVE